MIKQHVAVEQSQGPVTATCDVDPACCSGQEQSQGPVTATCDVDPTCCSGQDQSRGPVTAISDVARVVAGARNVPKSREVPKPGTQIYY